jgi:hypothetical protein
VSDRPYWLTTSCPKWCTEQHEAGDAVNRREHRSEELGALILTPMGTRHSAEPVNGWVYLVQGYREIGPLVHIHQEHKVVLICTLDEARQLAAAILDAVRLGESE